MRRRRRSRRRPGGEAEATSLGFAGGAATRRGRDAGAGRREVRSRSEGHPGAPRPRGKSNASGVKPKAGGRDGLERVWVTRGARGSGARCATSFGASRCAARREGATRLVVLVRRPKFSPRVFNITGMGRLKYAGGPSRVSIGLRSTRWRARAARHPRSGVLVDALDALPTFPRRPPRASAVSPPSSRASSPASSRALRSRLVVASPRAPPRRERRPFPGISSGGRHVQRLRQLQQGGQQRRRRAQPPAHRRRRGTPPRVRVPGRRPGGRLRHGSARRPPRPAPRPSPSSPPTWTIPPSTPSPTTPPISPTSVRPSSSTRRASGIPPPSRSPARPPSPPSSP